MKNPKGTLQHTDLIPELLAPAGDFECLQAALHFGADAVYFAGKQFSLRAGAGNFTPDGLKKAVALCHSKGKKSYVACNIFAHNRDFAELPDYLKFLQSISVDALIISDPGVFVLAKKFAPNIPIHLSTQANTTNRYSAAFWAEQGIKRIVLSRELTLPEIREIRDALPPSVELEAFVHGAMCVAYSGRCLLSAVLAGRSGNRGECAQSCRWEYESCQGDGGILTTFDSCQKTCVSVEGGQGTSVPLTTWQYEIREKSRKGEYMAVEGDARGSYILNSKDMNLLMHFDKLCAAGITCFKIEGRSKGAYYVANTVNAYRRAIDLFSRSENKSSEELGIRSEELRMLDAELFKSAHRKYFTGFYFNEPNCPTPTGSSNPEPRIPNPEPTINSESSVPIQNRQFVALVTGEKDGLIEIEQRNRFRAGDALEVLSPDENFNKTFLVDALFDADGNPVADAKLVQQKLFLKTGLKLKRGDMLRIANR
ncbi:MAG: U32 family peptidase [Firmicutes bacterium]|nr:U32 family peptidase [Bacillota bacterium]